MKKSFYFYLTFASLLFLFTFTQCQKEESPVAFENETSHLAFKFNAADFIASLDQENQDFSGIIVKVVDGQLQFEKVKIEKGLFQLIHLDNQPTAVAGHLDATGAFHLKSEKDKQDFEFWKNNFELAYFTRQDLNLLAHHSNYLYISGLQINFGKTIHAEKSSEQEDFYFSLKIQGDFKKNMQIQELDRNEIMDIPMTIIGLPCPREWG